MASRWIDIDRKILFGHRSRHGLGNAGRGEGKPGPERKIDQLNEPSASSTAAHDLTPFFQAQRAASARLVHRRADRAGFDSRAN